MWGRASIVPRMIAVVLVACCVVSWTTAGASEASHTVPDNQAQTQSLLALLREIRLLEEDTQWLDITIDGRSNRELVTQLRTLVETDQSLLTNRLSDADILLTIQDLIPRLSEERQEHLTVISTHVNRIALDDLTAILAWSGDHSARYEARLREAENKYTDALQHLSKKRYIQSLKQLIDAHTVVLETMEKIGFGYDIEEDSDQDGLGDLIELLLGTNPLSSDSDVDGLLDGYEALFSSTSPLDADSDDNGTSDADEDTDEDTLTHRHEASMGTHPRRSDSDIDGIRDDGELQTYLTDPQDPDSDEDGLDDGDELKLGTDPLNPDSNNNGVMDGDENYTVSISLDLIHPETRVIPTVTMTVPGDLAFTTSITDVSGMNAALSSDLPGYLGATYEFKTEAPFSEATLSFSLRADLAAGEDSFLPTIFHYNEVTGQLEKLPNQNYDPEILQVTATVTHFSTYLVLNGAKWDEVWSRDFAPPRSGDDGSIRYVDIVFAIDSSGSMLSNDPTDLRKTAAKNFVDKLADQDRSAVVDFDSSARTLVGLTSDKGAVKVAIDQINSSGGTNLYLGLNQAVDELILNSTGDQSKYVIFLTDGNGSFDSSVIQKAKDNSVKVYTIGLGRGVLEWLLRTIAAETGGQYYFAERASELEEIFQDTADDTVVPFKDTDGDGLSDYDETNGIRLSTGITVFLDPLKVDTDEDGLQDGAELGSYDHVAGYGGFYTFTSRPDVPDSDGDRYEDAEDARPLIFDIHERTLVSFSDAAYVNLEKHRNKWLKDISSDLFKKRALFEYGRKTEIDNWYIIDAEDSHWYDSGFGALAVKLQNKIVIAFRGTDFPQPGDIVADLNLWMLHWNHMIPMAKQFVADTVLQNPDAEVYVTGHSLGGFIAQKVSYDFVENEIHEAYSWFSPKKRARIQEIIGQDGYFQKGVTFNAPGFTANYGSVVFDFFIDTVPLGSVTDAKYEPYIHNYLIRDDLVGTIGTHVGHDHILEYSLPDTGVMKEHGLKNFYPHF